MIGRWPMADGKTGMADTVTSGRSDRVIEQLEVVDCRRKRMPDRGTLRSFQRNFRMAGLAKSRLPALSRFSD
jgi:hypothetical protein